MIRLDQTTKHLQSIRLCCWWRMESSCFFLLSISFVLNLSFYILKLVLNHLCMSCDMIKFNYVSMNIFRTLYEYDVSSGSKERSSFCIRESYSFMNLRWISFGLKGIRSRKILEKGASKIWYENDVWTGINTTPLILKNEKDESLWMKIYMNR